MSEVEQSQQENIPSSAATEATATSNASATAKAAEEGKRVYIGNIPFKTYPAQIRELFGDFEVLSVTIPKTRTQSKDGGVFFRKLGYAFAELPSKEEAERAVKELQGKSLNDRELSIKLAKAIVKKPRKVSEKKDVSASEGEGVSTSTEKKSKPRQKRVAGPDTTDSVFVNNLSPDAKKEDLEELFKGLKIVDAKVTSKGARKTKRKGELVTIPARAFALVKFEQESDQQKAVDGFNGKTFQDKEITVQIAKEIQKVDVDETEQKSEKKEEIKGENAVSEAVAAEGITA